MQANLQRFLQLALNVNTGRYPSLADFLYALKRSQARAQDGQSESEPLGMRDAVRILTVHASKGLEAPIVFLIDMKTSAERTPTNYWLIDWHPDDSAPAHVSWVSTGERIGAWRSERRKVARALDEQEHFNKCYVAMTRARQMLVVSAAQELGDEDDAADKNAEKPASPAKNGLFEQLLHAVQSLDPVASGVLPDQPQLWSSHAAQWREACSAHVDIAVKDEWVNTAAATTAVNVYSDIEADEAALNRQMPMVPLAQDNHALTLGSVLHQALEWFSQPNPPHELNDEWLSEHYAISLSEAQQVRQWCETIVHQPQWRAWFDPTQYDEAHNEMSLMTADGQIKRMDRWVREGSTISVLDYKSGWDAVALMAYEQQLREYVTLMQDIYPECAVRGYLLRVDGVAHEVR